MNKYYTPKIEDFYLGYEFEELIEEQWIPQIFDRDWQICVFEELFLNKGAIRVSYLTKEQIEVEGWVHIGGQLQSESRQYFELIKSPHGHLELNYTEYNTNLIIQQRNHVRDASGNYILLTIFRGKCPSINELRIITKLLGI